MSTSYLPEDLLVLVFVRLPLRSLGRFKSLSRSINALISSQEFIKLHLNHSCINQIPSILLSANVVDFDTLGKNFSQKTHAVEFSTIEETSEIGCKVQWLHLPFKNLVSRSESKIIGSCNGLLCRIITHNLLDEYCYYDVSLCNPLTKLTWDLPKGPVVFNSYRFHRQKNRISFGGFGYDDVHDDYKVMIAFCPSLMHIHEYDYEYEVYSLKSNSWSIIKSYLDVRYHSICDDSPSANCVDGILVNCALHWILETMFSGDDQRTRNTILAFDLRTDKNKILPIPKVLEEIRFLRLSVLNGCLVLSNCRYSSFDASIRAFFYDFDLWVMKDYDLKDSWMRITLRNLLNLPGLCFLTPVALLEDNHKRKLIYYNHHTGIISSYDFVYHQVLEFRASDDGYQGTKLLPFVGSLVEPHPPSYGDTKYMEE